MAVFSPVEFWKYLGIFWIAPTWGQVAVLRVSRGQMLGELLNILQCRQECPPPKNDETQNVNSAKIEKA